MNKNKKAYQEYLEASIELDKSKASLRAVSLFESLNELYKKHLINLEEFTSAKASLLHGYVPNNYKGDYLNAIPVLYDVLSRGIINDTEYRSAVWYSLDGLRSKFDARLLRSGMITFKDYTSNHALLKKLYEHGSGYYDLTAIVLLLNEMADYRVTESSYNFLYHKVLLENKNKSLKVFQYFGILGPYKSRISDGKHSHVFSTSDVKQIINKKDGSL